MEIDDNPVIFYGIIEYIYMNISSSISSSIIIYNPVIPCYTSIFHEQILEMGHPDPMDSRPLRRSGTSLGHGMNMEGMLRDLKKNGKYQYTITLYMYVMIGYVWPN